MKVAIIKDDTMDYCRDAPYHPSMKYPEYPFCETSEINLPYDQVRVLFHNLGMDGANYGKETWNPLGEVIKPGDSVFLKPNLVGHHNHMGSTDAIITNGSVLRAVLDYVYIALKGRGSITIGDAPYIDTDFDAALKVTGIDKIAEYYNARAKIKLNVLDLRKEKGTTKHGRMEKELLSGDPLGYRVVDLKADSEHNSIIEDYASFRVVSYDSREMIEHHNGTRNEYCIAGSILNSDVIINLPKMKTHAKTGISCALKNIVGINGYKGWLPHHRAGPADRCGDEYERSDIRKDLLVKIRDGIAMADSPLKIALLRAMNMLLFASRHVIPYKDDIYGGNWYGNDTLPRTIVDLNKILYYADKSGAMMDVPQRKEFIVVDGIVAGEKEGPLENCTRKCGLLVAGYNPVEVDMVCSSAMGFDYRKMSTFKYAMSARKYGIYDGDPRDIEIASDQCKIASDRCKIASDRCKIASDRCKIASDRCKALDGVFGAFNCGLAPPKGWAGHIEYEDKAGMTPAGTAVSAPGSAPLKHTGGIGIMALIRH